MNLPAEVALGEPVDTNPGRGIPGAALRAFERSLSGKIVTPASCDYNSARQIFNAAIDRRPAVIAYCADNDDVAATIRLARDHDQALNIRSGGAGNAGYCLNDGGVVLDVSGLDSVRVDTDTAHVVVGAGARLQKVYADSIPRGLVIPAGECPMVGAAGLTLGGGISLLGRSLGFTVDRLIEAELISAEGETLIASADSHPELFWALRGAGNGSFGAVTSLTFRGSRRGTHVFAGSGQWPLERAVDALVDVQEYMYSGAPNELDAAFMLYSSDGVRHLLVVPVYNGTEADGQPIIRPLWKSPGCYMDMQTYDYLAYLEGQFHAPKTRPYEYWKSGFVTQPLDRAALELMVESFANCPSEDALIAFELCGGAMNEVPRNDTAFVHRTHFAVVSIFADAGTANDPVIEWARQLHHALMQAGAYSHHQYQNYRDAENPDWEHAYYGGHYPRLQRIKASYDPEDFFHFEQSIRLPGKSSPTYNAAVTRTPER